MFRVQRRQCSTCIYRKDSPLDINQLEADIVDPYGGFTGHRICHHSPDSDPVCCAGFWARHKDEFAMGQVSQRMNFVEFVEVDCFSHLEHLMSVPQKFVTYEHPDTGYDIEAMTEEEFSENGKQRILTADCYVWQMATSKEEAIANHIEKHRAWEADMEAGRPEKDVY